MTPPAPTPSEGVKERLRGRLGGKGECRIISRGDACTCGLCDLDRALAQAEREREIVIEDNIRLMNEVERLKGELCKVTQVSGGPTTPDDIDAGPYDTVDKLWARLNQAEADLARVRALEAALRNTAGRVDGDGKPCWCLTELSSGLWVNGHAPYCVTARAALGQPAPTPEGEQG